MGRYFKAQPVELNRDFIYQPPLELMMAANKFKNEELQQQGNNIQTLLDSLPFRYKDIDKENYTNIQNELNDKVKSVTEMYNKDMTSPEARKKLAELRDEIKTRYSSGDIYNIQKTNDNYDAFEKLMDDKKLTEIEKARFRDGYWNKFSKENPTGSLKNFFTPGNIVEDNDLLPEYAKYHKLNEPTIEASVKQKMGYKWDNLTKDEQKYVVFENGFRDWVDATPSAKDMLKQQKNSGVFNDRDIHFTDTDQLDMTKGYGKNMFAATKALDYMQHTNSDTNELNAAYEMEENWRRQDEATRKANRDLFLLENGKNVNSNFDTSDTVRYHFQNEIEDIMTGLVPKGSKTGYTKEFFDKNFAGKGNLEMYKTMKKALEKGIINNPKSKNLRTALDKLEFQKKRYDEGMNATYAQLGSYGIDAKTVNEIREKTNTVINSNFNSLKMTFPGINIIKNGNKIPAKDIRPESLYNQELLLDNGLKIRVKKTKYEDKSNILYLPENTPSNMLNKSDTNINVEFSYEVYDNKTKKWITPSETNDFKLTRNAFLNNEKEIGLNGSLQ